MSEQNGEWKPFDDQYASTYHNCKDTTNESLEEKVLFLEKIVRKLNDKMQLQSESIRRLEDLK